MLQQLPGFCSLSFLELGCGDGWMLEQLLRSGVRSARGTTFRNRSHDYIRSREYPEGLTVDEGIDLNKPLPYAESQFDVVYSTEVIEHVEGHRNFLTEAARVLKPGGWLVLTTPNLHRLVSRFAFALSGIHANKRGLIPWSCELGRMEEYHHHCVDFPLLHWLLWGAGLRIEEMRPTEVRALSTIVSLLNPVLRLTTRFFVMRRATGEQPDRVARNDLLSWMNSRTLLSSEQICVRARKIPPSNAVQNSSP